jgi:lysophospholipase L1-like esterase
MRFARLVLATALAAMWLCSALPTVEAITNGACIGCLVAVGMTQQIAMLKHKTATNAFNDWCNDITANQATTICKTASSIVGPLLDLDLAFGRTPEHTCSKTVPLCKGEAGQCKLFDTWPPKRISTEQFSAKTSPFLNSAFPRSKELSGDAAWGQALLSSSNPVQEAIAFFAEQFAQILRFAPRPEAGADARTAASVIADLASFASLAPAPAALKAESAELARVATALSQDLGINHFPIVDKDGDRKSTFPQIRGYDWAGRDCNDWDKDIYPGRRSSVKPFSADHNCNGIAGLNPTTKKSYEEELCAGTPQFGLLSIGDSATAHFAAPPGWLDPTQASAEVYSNLFKVISNEADWPMCSSSTGWAPQEQCPKIHGGVTYTSLYQKLREANRCSHRDYHNLGVNGGSSRNMGPGDGILDSFVRDPEQDHPAIVMYSVIGNDVCGKDHTRMTPVDEFEANTIKAFEHLDTRLPAGSQLLVGALVDGRVLYDTMEHQIHPSGTSYKAFYDFLNCMKTSPCSGWMNSDESIRNATTARAAELSAVYPKIIAERSFKNFNVTYIPTMQIFSQIVEDWVAKGNPATQLIELTDGFHPSTTTQSLLAEAQWNYAIRHGLSVPVNPHNAKIEAIFGHQGGYIDN